MGATGFERVEVRAPNARAAAERLASRPGVVAAEPDARVSLDFTPNDTFFLTDPITGLGQWGIRKAQVDKAWDIQRGSPSIVVAVIDTGADSAHPDLQGALAPGARFITAPDPICPPGTTTRDDSGHGTHVAGIIAANGNNGQGIAGVAFGVKVMPIKALDCTGAGFLSDVANAITFAADAGARIINISLGSAVDSATLRSAVSYALAKNVVVIAAAGNCGTTSGAPSCPTLNAPSYPAAQPGVIAVGATDTDDQPAAFSTAASYVAVAAPGVAILSTFPTYHVELNDEGVRDNGYTAIRGTSQAAPLVAGVGALLLSRDPSLTPSAVAQRLRSTADDVYIRGYDTKTGDGRVNALRALGGGPPARITLTPATTMLVPFQAQKFTAQVTDAFGTPVIAPISWTATGGSVTSAGVYTAGATPGTYSVTAQAGAASAFSTVTIAPARYGATYAPQTARSLLASGTSATLRVAVTNLSNFTWSSTSASPVDISSHWYTASGDVAVWDGPRAALPSEVPPGGSASVDLPLQVPVAKGQYTLKIDAVREGVAWFSEQGVAPSALSIVVNSGFDASYQPGPQSLTLSTGAAPTQLQVQLTNTGSRTWTAAGSAPVRLGYHWRDAAGNVVIWDGARGALPNDVAPGANAAVTLGVSPPRAVGAYSLELDLVQEGVTWFSADGIAPKRIAATVASGYGARYEVPQPTRSLLPGTRAAFTVNVLNTGVFTWSASGTLPVHLSYHLLDAARNVAVWDGNRANLPTDVQPGAVAVIPVPFDAPAVPGTYFVRVDLVREGDSWFSAQGTAPLDLALLVDADRRASLSFPATAVSRTAPQVTVTVRNASGVTFTSDGASPVHLSSHWLAADGGVLVWDGPRANLPRPLLPGDQADVTLPLALPPAGATTLVVDLVQEGAAWFGAGFARTIGFLP